MQQTHVAPDFSSVRRILCWLAVAVMACSGLALATPVYNTPVEPSDWTGSRSIVSGLAGTGSWGDNFGIGWSITQHDPNSLLYTYTLSWNQGDPSHIIFELSDGCASATAGCVWGFLVNGQTPETVSYGTFGPAPSNPNFPAGSSIYGVKIDTPSGVNGSVFSFYSNRLPVWGNFYAKDGQAGGMGWNAVWNTGLVNPTDPNWTTGAFIARPDTDAWMPEIPEPGTMLLLGIGLAALGLYRRKF